MRARLSMAVVLLALIFAGVLVLTGCGGAPENPAVDPTSSTPALSPDAQPEPIVRGDDAGNPDMNAQPPLESGTASITREDVNDSLDSNETAVAVTWTRASGVLKHNDELSIETSGRVVAIVRNAEQAEHVVQGALDEGEATRLMAWVRDYASFTRREIDDMHAVSTTQLHGSGSMIPSSEIQAEIASTITSIFFDMTDTQ